MTRNQWDGIAANPQQRPWTGLTLVTDMLQAASGTDSSCKGRRAQPMAWVHRVPTWTRTPLPGEGEQRCVAVGEEGSAWEAGGLHHGLLFGSELSSVAAAGCKRRGFQTWVPNTNQVLHLS